MALEDFTTYTEVDTAGRLTVTSDTITIENLDRDEDSYIYADKGADFFDGDYEHLLQLGVSEGLFLEYGPGDPSLRSYNSTVVIVIGVMPIFGIKHRTK